MDYNIDYFKTIDSSNKAYYLGFILGDGNISDRYKKGKCFSISTAEKDKELLYKFKEEIQGKEVNIKSRPNSNFPGYVSQDTYRISLYNKTFINNIINYGIVPNKTINYTGLVNFPDNYKLEFLIGLFDADGCINLSHVTENRRGKQYHRPKFTFHITSYLELVCKEAQEIFQTYGINIKIYKHKEKYFQLKTCSKEAISKIYDLFNSVEVNRFKRKMDILKLSKLTLRELRDLKVS